MSCTENESGPFVVFFLPAVVGCLTILLARRWANSQVTNTSSTAVSRRRKIIKDPLIKRPLPPLACPKMVQPGSKKLGVAKKGSYLVTDEDLNGSGKRVKRLSPSSGTAVTEAKVLDGPVAPKHIPFPYIPQDGDLLFEAMTFVFTIVAMGLQFLNLYRTSWWLSHIQTTQAMNFYLIDPHLVALIVALVCRRVLLATTLALLRYLLAPKLLPHATTAARMFILGVVLGLTAWYAYLLFLKHPLVKIFYLCYPAVIYFILFGFQLSPFLELNSGDAPLHCCSHDPQQIRAEVEVLKQDFNGRVKKILFNSVVGAYYSSFIPLCFAQSYLYYDVYSASQQVAFVWGGLFARYCSQLLSASYCDVLHRAALHLVEQKTDAPAAPAPTPPNGPVQWAGPAGAGGAAGEAREWRVFPKAPTLAPADQEHARFFVVFINPSALQCLMLCLQLSFIALQLCILFSSIVWHFFISIVILLFINYYTLFKMLRDYLVAWKVYKAEHMIQEKNYGKMLCLVCAEPGKCGSCVRPGLHQSEILLVVASRHISQPHIRLWRPDLSQLCKQNF